MPNSTLPLQVSTVGVAPFFAFAQKFGGLSQDKKLRIIEPRTAQRVEKRC